MSDAERSAEVGDCQSLLGRAYFVAGDLVKARAASREAIDQILDATSKDYADLQILLGDLAYAENDTDAAVSFYDEAIRTAGISDAERSEIAARAWLQKGHAIKSKSSFDRAAEMWATLEEDELADGARWHSMLLDGHIPSGAQRVLEKEAASVRVETIRLHEVQLAGLGSSRGRRSVPSKEYWKELLPQARNNVAIKHIEW